MSRFFGRIALPFFLFLGASGVALFAGGAPESIVPDGVPENPQRIVALDPFTFEAMLAIDAPVVATPGRYIDEMLAKDPTLAPRMEGITRLDIPPDVESVLSLAPDVILCRRTACGRQAGSLARVAPMVIFSNSSSADWQESARFFADAIGQSGAMDRVEESYRRRVDHLRAAVQARFGSEFATVSLVRIMPGRVRIYFAESFAGVIMQAAGLQHPQHQRRLAEQNRNASRFYQISLEELRLIDADRVFVYTTDLLADGEAAEYLEQVQANALWDRLEAVQNDQLHLVGNHWFAAGYLAADAVIDDLYRYVLETEPVPDGGSR